jgi:acyl-CoA dehydrogenase
MDFEPSPRTRELEPRILEFVEERVYPAESVQARQLAEAGDRHFHAPVIVALKAEARAAGLWNLFLPDPELGAGLTNVEYAPLAALMGRSTLAPEAFNCSAPDTGNMELLHQFGTDAQNERWLEPLLAGEIRSAFAMTEPGIASSDARQIGLSIERRDGELVLNGRKWWTTNALHQHCQILIAMGKTDLDAPPHRQHSMILVPLETPGVEVLRGLTVFGYDDPEGHGEIVFDDVRVPTENLLGGEGEGFAMAQARLGPGRIHHCMRAIGAAERALQLLCERAEERSTFGEPLASRSAIQDWIAESRIEIEMARMIVLKTAWLIDSVGARQARTEISGIKFAVPEICLRVLDRAIQLHGGAGVSGDLPLARLWAGLRTLRIVDGPDEVHKMSLARRELAQQRERRG